MFGRAHCDAEFVRQSRHIEVSDENVLSGQLFVQVTRRKVRALSQHEIGVAVNHMQAEASQVLCQRGSCGLGPLDVVSEMGLILYGSRGSGEGHDIHVVRILDLHQAADQVRVGHGIAESNACQGIALAHGSKNNHIVQVSNEIHAVGVCEITVCLVNQEHTLKLPGQVCQSIRLDQRAGRCIGIAHYCQRGAHLCQVVGQRKLIAKGHFCAGAVLNSGQNGIERVGGYRVGHRPGFVAECPEHQGQQVIAAIAAQNGVRR